MSEPAMETKPEPVPPMHHQLEPATVSLLEPEQDVITVPRLEHHVHPELVAIPLLHLGPASPCLHLGLWLHLCLALVRHHLGSTRLPRPSGCTLVSCCPGFGVDFRASACASALPPLAPPGFFFPPALPWSSLPP